ncbi:MAG: hypothetical protein OXQ29_07805 [Rhodospirillaceae bacterium]|nr:hypothetical protein [Rhodospirillaceae bacterium]
MRGHSEQGCQGVTALVQLPPPFLADQHGGGVALGAEVDQQHTLSQQGGQRLGQPDRDRGLADAHMETDGSNDLGHREDSANPEPMDLATGAARMPRIPLQVNTVRISEQAANAR